jgi:hypothetical protein
MQNVLPDFFIIPTEIALDEDLQPLDGYVYAIIYWYTKLKLERCIASNKQIADILSSRFKSKKAVNPTSVANSFTRLTKKKYVKVVMDYLNHRVEAIPLITFTAKSDYRPSSNDDGVEKVVKSTKSAPPSSNDEPPFIISLTPPSSNDDAYIKSNNNKQVIFNNNINTKEKINKKESSVAVAPLPLQESIKYSLLEDLTQQDFEEIANHYNVPLSFVQSKYEDMCLWVGEKPSSKRGVGRNWRLTLMNWVKRDGQRILERSKGDPTKRGIDARNL